MKGQQKAWAIKLGIRDNTDFGYIGHFWFTDHLDPWQDGNRVSLFRTRSQARYSMKRSQVKNRYLFPNAKVVRVKVNINE